MERKIGEIFEYNGEWYQCVDGNCAYCSLQDEACGQRIINDVCKLNHIFKKLEKVGEPYEALGKLFQPYKLSENIPIPVWDVNYFMCPHWKEGIVDIEIKQTKEEDMEEKKVNNESCGDNRFEVIERAKRHLLHSTNIGSSKEEMKLLDVFLFRCWQMGWLDSYDDTKHSNSEKVGKNLRPFDLQKAREGKPVCTRDGRKARIICFDAKGSMPIVALISNGDYENLHRYYNSGSNYNVDNDYDLMMLPEKKEGWIIVSKNATIYDSLEDAKKSFDSDKELCICKAEWEE